jgi:hypothetical protein
MASGLPTVALRPTRWTSCRETGRGARDAQEVRAAVGAGERVDLVDDDDAQVGEEARVSIAARRASPRATRAWSSAARRARAGRCGARGGGVAVPHEAAQADHLGVEAEALGLVVEQRLDRRDVEGARPRRSGSSSSSESVGKIDASVLPPAVGARTTAFCRRAAPRPASSCTGRRLDQPRRATIACCRRGASARRRSPDVLDGDRRPRRRGVGRAGLAGERRQLLLGAELAALKPYSRIGS